MAGEMEALEKTVRQLVEQVLKETHESPASVVSEGSRLGIFSGVDAAVRAAVTAQQELAALPLEKRSKLIQAMREAAVSHSQELSRDAVSETGLGRVDSKVMKNVLAAMKTPGVEDLQAEAFTDDHGLTLVERAPHGVIGSIIPCTNPTATVISNAIGMIAAGNTVVFNPHPAAKRVSCRAVEILNEAVIGAGGPPNLAVAVAEPTIQTATEIMARPEVALLVVTGGPGVVQAAMNSGKKVIAAGPGNPSCVVDESADLAKAGKDIVDGASFDNNIVCICEKEILVVKEAADRLKQEMLRNGAYELNPAQIDAVTRLVLGQPSPPGREGSPNKEWVGKSASRIAAAIGVSVQDTVRLLFAEVNRDHPLVWTEQLMPVIPLVRMNDVDAAIQFAMECEHGYRHTAVMHSRNVEKLSKMARLMNCSLFVKNGPSYSGLGQGGAGFTSFTIASPTGEGLTRARTFTRERRCTLVGHFRIV